MDPLTPLKDIVQQKRGVSREVSIDSSRLRTQSPMFIDTLKGLIFCFKHFQCLGPKKRGVHFYVTCAAKNSEARCVTLRVSPFGDTSNAATIAAKKRDVLLLEEKIKNIFSN
jgi:hypothetical protein